jgi:hypothetical protein
MTVWGAGVVAALALLLLVAQPVRVSGRYFFGDGCAVSDVAGFAAHSGVGTENPGCSSFIHSGVVMNGGCFMPTNSAGLGISDNASDGV